MLSITCGSYTLILLQIFQGPSGKQVIQTLTLWGIFMCSLSLVNLHARLPKLCFYS